MLGSFYCSILLLHCFTRINLAYRTHLWFPSMQNATHVHSGYLHDDDWWFLSTWFRSSQIHLQVSKIWILYLADDNILGYALSFSIDCRGSISPLISCRSSSGMSSAWHQFFVDSIWPTFTYTWHIFGGKLLLPSRWQWCLMSLDGHSSLATCHLPLCTYCSYLLPHWIVVYYYYSRNTLYYRILFNLIWLM